MNAHISGRVKSYAAFCHRRIIYWGFFFSYFFVALSELPVRNEYVADSRASGQHRQEEHASLDRSVLSF